MAEDSDEAPKQTALEPCHELARYPKKLADLEHAALGHKPRVGFALSGGGIRSATFALGLFQGLAKLELLRHIDILSTVSGGGYFGSFLGHLIQRDGEAEAQKRNPGQSAPNRDRDRADRLLRDQGSQSLHYLRRNGRYLSPNGAGDLLAAGAVALRNWVSVLVMIGLVALLVFAGLGIARYTIEEWFISTHVSLRWPFPWLSPWFAVAALAVPLVAVPPAWAYWLVDERPPFNGLVRGVARWAVVFTGAVAAVVMFFQLFRSRNAPADEPWGVDQWLLMAFVTAALLAAVRYVTRRARASRDSVQHTMRRILSRDLSRGLLVIGVLLAVATFDTAGTALIHFARSGAIAALSATVLVGVLRSPLLALTARLGAHERPAIPTNVLIHVVAALVLLLFFGGIAAIPHLVALNGESLATSLPNGSLNDALDRLWMLTFVVAVVVALSASLWPFVNRSSLHALYEARLRRAYLGASNPERLDEALERPPLTEPRPNDGLRWDAYRPHAYGGPIHLVNVTINETVDGRSRLEQRDRKGVGMAVGPHGLSVGVAHHALWAPEKPDESLAEAMKQSLSDSAEVLRDALSRRSQERSGQLAAPQAAASPSATRFRVFPDTASPERLDVGQWVAISGGAVSTGLGSRTNVALSILTGFFNVRLGYWWRSGVRVAQRQATTTRTRTQRALSLLRGVLPMQFALIDEWFARFPGTARADWYLTDGGHFENLGAYELIRRELPLIIISDAEQDAPHKFGGLANLVRKARVDFDTEICFLTDNELRRNRAADAPPVAEGMTRIGTLDALRRGHRSEEPVKDPVTNERRIVTDGAAEMLSLAHAAVARVTYPRRVDADKSGPPKTGWLIYIKPTLDGDEPVDVRQYHADNPSFPHESTADQFFDEAQWESYRRLGEHIAEEVFGTAKLGQWLSSNAKESH